jgi:hypothetical protein
VVIFLDLLHYSLDCETEVSIDDLEFEHDDQPLINEEIKLIIYRIIIVLSNFIEKHPEFTLIAISKVFEIVIKEEKMVKLRVKQEVEEILEDKDFVGNFLTRLEQNLRKFEGSCGDMIRILISFSFTEDVANKIVGLTEYIEEHISPSYKEMIAEKYLKEDYQDHFDASLEFFLRFLEAAIDKEDYITIMRLIELNNFLEKINDSTVEKAQEIDESAV